MSWGLAAAGLAFAAIAASSGPAAARDGDPRLRKVEWRSGEAIELAARTGRTLAVMLAPGEVVSTISVAEPGAFAVERSLDGDGLLITPRRPGARTVLAVETSLRTYRFELVARDAPATPLIVRLTYPRDRGGAANRGPAGPHTGWKVSGERSLRPSAIRDDGARTFISWSEDQAIPAVFAVTASGGEQVVDGYMRDGAFVIDRVHPRLVFRIDAAKARADRQAPRK